MAEETQHLQAEIKPLSYKDCLGWGDPVLDKFLNAGVSTESPKTYPIESVLYQTAAAFQGSDSGDFACVFYVAA